jgi:hypothetical protein
MMEILQRILVFIFDSGYFILISVVAAACIPGWLFSYFKKSMSIFDILTPLLTALLWQILYEIEFGSRSYSSDIFQVLFFVPIFVISTFYIKVLKFKNSNREKTVNYLYMGINLLYVVLIRIIFPDLPE